jgi:6-methylsalicylate decarboxylase
MTRLHRIDVHHHIMPPRYAAWLKDKGVRPGGVDVPDWSPHAGLHLMDAVGIRASILSLSTPGVWFGDAIEAERWAREVNEYTAEVVSEHPDRFGFFATVTLPDVQTAIKAADHAYEQLGADGIVLLANNDGRYLGDAAFAPLLQHLNERRAVVFIHPGELPAAPVEGIPSFTADFLLDTTRSAISLVLSGALQRYDRIRFILAHAGGFVPYIADRILLTMLRTESKLSQARMLIDQDRQCTRRLELLRSFTSTSRCRPRRLRCPACSPSPTRPTSCLAPTTRSLPRPRSSTWPSSTRTTLSTRCPGIDHRNAQPLFPRLFA